MKREKLERIRRKEEASYEMIEKQSLAVKKEKKDLEAKEKLNQDEDAENDIFKSEDEQNLSLENIQQALDVLKNKDPKSRNSNQQMKNEGFNEEDFSGESLESEEELEEIKQFNNNNRHDLFNGFYNELEKQPGIFEQEIQQSGKTNQKTTKVTDIVIGYHWKNSSVGLDEQKEPISQDNSSELNKPLEIPKTFKPPSKDKTIKSPEFPQDSKIPYFINP